MGDAIGVNNEPIRVLIAEDDVTFRLVIRSVLDAEPDLEVVAEAPDGEEAIALATEHVPQVVVMDIRMPKLSGIDATRVLKELHPNTKVLMLTISDEEGDLFAAIEAGAAGYLLKDTNPDEVVAAVRRIFTGQATLSPAMAEKLKSELASHVMTDDAGIRPLVTKPELDVLHHLAAGLTPAAVGAKLGARESVVGSHLYSLLTKLHIHDRMRSVAEAVRAELGFDEDVDNNL
jgi:two-component system NarL family response regulator